MYSLSLKELYLHLSDPIIKTRKKVVIATLIVILYKRDVLFLSKRRFVYLANEDIPTSVRTQEFLPGIV